jgi:hypothetical protein
MRINVAYMSQAATDGSAKRFVVFEARALDGNNQGLLKQLSEKARAMGMDFEWAALAFANEGRLAFFGTPALTQHLASTRWVPSWTHTLDH